MDFNHLYARHQTSLIMAQNAGCDAARFAHLSLADGYLHQIALLRNERSEDRDSEGVDADAMQEEAASYRRLARRARTPGGAAALSGMADLADSAARRGRRHDNVATVTAAFASEAGR